MNSTLGMVLTALVIVCCGAGGIWYWLKIKEAPKKNETNSKPNLLSGEPVYNPSKSAANSEVNTKRVASEQPEASPGQPTEDTIKTIESESVPPVEKSPSAAQASPVSGKSTESSAKPVEGYNYDTTAKNLKEKHQQKQKDLINSSYETSIPSSYEQDAMSFDEALRFENIKAGDVPAHNPFLEAAFKINFKTPVTGTQLLKELAPINTLEPKGSYRFYAFEDTAKRWDRPEAYGIYSAVILFVQLAGASGVVSDVSIASFIQIKQRIEMRLDGSSDEIEEQDISQKSKKLTSLLAEFGVQITLYLRCRREITTDEFEKVSSELGFKRITAKSYEKLGELVQTADGKYSKNRKGAISVNWISPNYVAVSLFVALQTPESQPLKTLLMATNAFAGPFDAEIVDQQGYPIDGTVLTTLRKEVDKFYALMRERGLEPGSETAHRLFTKTDA